MRNARGFTIVELLIVIVVIAVLVAITVVAFNGIQARAQSSTVQNDLRSLSVKMKLFHADNDRYPSTISELNGLNFAASKSSYATSGTVTVNVGYCTNASTYSKFAVLAMTKGGERFVVTESAAPAPDATGVAWTSTTGSLSAHCTALGLSTNLSHGYLSTDSGTGPWRTWVGGN